MVQVDKPEITSSLLSILLASQPLLLNSRCEEWMAVHVLTYTQKSEDTQSLGQS